MASGLAVFTAGRRNHTISETGSSPLPVSPTQGNWRPTLGASCHRLGMVEDRILNFYKFNNRSCIHPRFTIPLFIEY